MAEETPSLGEFELIDRIVARLRGAAATDILVPPGDDAAAWAMTAPHAVATTDVMVEGNHWRPHTLSWADVGWKAIASNVSDIAAMGATPRYAVVGLVLSKEIGIPEVDALVDGMRDACAAFEVRIAGGDIVRGDQAVVSVTLFGDSASDDLLRRGAARPGDAVAVSGVVGASAAGLAVIEAGRATDASCRPLLAAHRRPVARVALGQAALTAGVRCAIDISDGLLQDLGHVAHRSKAGIEIELAALPVHPAAVDALGRRAALDLALGGGEDYELALSAPRDVLARIGPVDVPCTVIGRVTAQHPGEVWALDEAGSRWEAPRLGWDQLRSQDGALR